MKEKSKIFEEFYYLTDNKIYNIDVIENYANAHDGDFQLYKGNMFCPECIKAELTFYRKTSKKRAYLKRIPNSTHKEDCSFNYEYVSHKTAIKYIDKLKQNEVQDKINSMMNVLFRKPKPKKTITYVNNDNSIKKPLNPMLIPITKKNTVVLKTFRRKNLNAWIDKSSGEELCVFYGNVKLKLEEKVKKTENLEKPYKYNLLKIYTKNKNNEWKWRTNIYRGKIKDFVDENDIYNIVIIGNLDFSYKFWSIKLVSKDAIKFKKCN